MKKTLHLISFDIPYPPKYGGVIDVFYKIKALKALDIDVILHCFQYGKPEQTKLNKFCSKVYYYKRNSFVSSMLSNGYPFIVKSRGNDELIYNLKQDHNPILFDGLHTTYILNLHNFSDRKLFLRAHNVEHQFYKGLAKSESNIFKRNFFKQESKKLKKYEAILHQMDAIFSISPLEQEYFFKKYGDKCYYIPAFHDAQVHTRYNSKGKFVLYHGNIVVSENVKAALFLIDVYKDSEYQLVIASSYFNDEVTKEILKYDNIVFHSLEKEVDLNRLFENAHINVLPTFQNTGIKLKLLNTLYQGKFVIANDFMIDQTGLESLCEKANTKAEFLQKTKELFQQEFTKDMLVKRENILNNFNPKTGAQKIIDVIF
ncbi:glycosyltransferase [Pseudotenacibaculum sp. MALMAid0570]|uniref:glycosyltransferase n=1 Tax=Pseudotenacibaculum sp. MALMAid0570 TaxID=3143938 RepID=UPI0032E04003